MNLRSRSTASSKKTSGQSRTVLGDVGNRVESRVRRNNLKSVAIKKNRKPATNTSLVQLDVSKGDDSSDILTNVKESNTARRCSSRLTIKRQRDNQPEKEEKQTKRQRKTLSKETRQSHIKKQEDDKFIDRRSHSRHPRHINDIKDDETEVQQYLVHPKFRLRRQSLDCKSLVSGIAAHDESNLDDELQVVPYVTDLFQHLYREEEKYRPQMYMTLQRDINAKMRAILIDWLVEVHMKFRLVPETLFLCVNIIDRYCLKGHVMRSQLQLVGVTALLVACKYEEIYPPEVSDCVYITDKAYTRNDILEMEQKIVHKLSFHITVPTAYPFLQRFLNVVKASSLVKHAATYYTERTLQEYELNKYRPSVISASAVILAMNNPDICQSDEFSSTLVSGMPSILLEYSEFDVEELRECARLIAEKVGEEPITASRRKLGAVKKKYENRKYMHVSATRLPCRDTCIFLR
mmetsp:Transcript_13117/g.15416  ORF Transcript_13117/g.15416 Transcript_13117/m.15416 type:complete len:463 (-) Transcript_13117:296-1684(-)